MKGKFSKFYRFDFDKGVPVIGGQMKWRSGVKKITAYSLQHAVEKFALPVIREYGLSAKLNVVKAWSSDDGKSWVELDLQNVLFAGYLAGCFEREKLVRFGQVNELVSKSMTH